MRLDAVPPIQSERLSLRWMSPRFIEASLEGNMEVAEQAIGGTVPEGWPDHDARRRLIMRLDQILQAPISADWLLRGMVRRSDEALIGYINFHDAPDERGRAELGYTVFEQFRRQGYATEAIGAMMAWAKGLRPIAAFVVSISPQNEPSLRLAASLGFEQVGSQIDEIDGEEWVFELDGAR